MLDGKSIQFLLERVKMTRLFRMLNALLSWVKTARENQQLHVRSVMEKMWNYLIRTEIHLRVIAQIFMFLMSGLLVKIFE